MNNNNNPGNIDRHSKKLLPEMMYLKLLVFFCWFFVTLLSNMGFGTTVKEVSFALVQSMSFDIMFYTIKEVGKFLRGPISVPYNLSLCNVVLSFVAAIFFEVTLVSVTSNHYLYQLYRKRLDFLRDFNVVLSILHGVFAAYGLIKSGNFELLYELFE